MNESSTLYRVWELYYIEQTSSYPEIVQKYCLMNLDPFTRPRHTISGKKKNKELLCTHCAWKKDKMQGLNWRESGSQD